MWVFGNVFDLLVLALEFHRFRRTNTRANAFFPVTNKSTQPTVFLSYELLTAVFTHSLLRFRSSFRIRL